jgi:hypothetical protein
MVHLFLKNIFPPVPLCGMNPTGRPKYDPSGSDPLRHGARRRAIHAFDFKDKGVDTGLRRYDEESPQPGHIEKDILQTRYGHEFSHSLPPATMTTIGWCAHRDAAFIAPQTLSEGVADLPRANHPEAAASDSACPARGNAP